MDFLCMVATMPDDMCATPPTSLISEIEPSALQICVGTDPIGLLCSDHPISLDAVDMKTIVQP